MGSRLVLIVEDNLDATEIYTSYLNHRGFAVLQAANATDGLALARKHHPTVVIMDAGLPGTDGWQATAALKADAITAHICVLMLTAHVFADSRHRADAAGVDAFVSKPCLPDDLVTTLEGLFSKAPCVTPPPRPAGRQVSQRRH